MEGNTVVEENHQSSNSNLISKSVESSIKIDSISIDLINANEKISADNCEHFSIRGYVSEIRKRDWKMCWPFESNKHDAEACRLPSFHVPKFRYWRCQNCLWDVGAKGSQNDCDPILKSCSGGLKSNSISHALILDDVEMLLSDFQQAPKLDILKEKKVDANASANLNNTTEFHPSSCIDIDKTKTGVAHGPTLGHNMESNDNLDKEMHVLTAEISSLMQKTYHTDDIGNLKSICNQSIDLCKPGCGHNEVADAELSGNINCIVKNAAKNHDTGKVISVADQRKELTACGMSRDAGSIEEACSADKSEESGHPSPELDECDYASSESAEIMVRNNPQDLHCDNLSGLHRRKTRKVRLLTELLSEKGDGDIDNIRTEGSPSNCIPEVSAAGNKLPVSQGQEHILGNLRRGLGQHRKRKLDQDEDWRPLETSSPIKACKEARIIKRDVESTDAIAKAFARMHLQNNMKKQCLKRRIDRSPSTGKRKNKKSLIFYESSSLVSIQENLPNEIGNKAGDVSNCNAADGVLLKDTHDTVTGGEVDFFALSAQKMDKKPSFKKRSKMPQVDDQQVSLITQNHGMLREDLITRKFLHTGPVMVPFHSAHQDTPNEKGPNLSLNSFLTTPRYDTQNNPQVEDRQISILTLQEGKEQVNRKATETKHVENFIFASKSLPDMPFGKEAYIDLSGRSGKGAYIDLKGRRTASRMPFLNEGQNYTSQVEIGSCSHMQQKQFYSTGSNLKKIGFQEHSAVIRKDSDQRANKMPEQGALDDIPMEIVELMAKHQYERCLPDAEYDRCQSEITNNIKSGQTMDFKKAYGKGEMSLLQKESTEKRNPCAKNGRNGIVKRGENMGPTKQKSVDYFSHADLNQLNMSKLQQTATPTTLGGFFQHQDQPLSGAQHFDSSSSRQNSAQGCKWIGDVANGSLHNCLQSSGTCNTCQGISQQSKETNQLWPSMLPNHMPFVYSIPQKCTSVTTTNIDVLLNSPSSMHKENTTGNRDLKFLNQNATSFGKQNRNFGSENLRRCAEYPFACKHNGIELNQKPMGSLDLYSNETIPAMHLLSLMHAGLRSSVPINLDVAPKFLKRPSITHDKDPQEFSRMDSGAYRATNAMKHTSYDCHGKNQLAENSYGRISSTSAVVGPTASSFQLDKCFQKATDFTHQVSQEKVKVKDSDSHTQNRGCRLQKSSTPSGNFGTNCGSIPVHSMQTMFFGASDSMTFPLQFRGLENSAKHKLEVPSGSQYVHPHKSNSETRICSVNRNPADFSVPEAGNIYMIAGEDLKFGKLVPLSNGYRSSRLVGQKRQKKLPAVKEHRRHLIS
ncbi:hypothetical protein JCGZ_07766 [Jatropha curcas]|uniref:Protein EMBRYONIC FLOWER 1 n=1 Tax=Jatropha curcas TaxID=180498 RepID=A0A067KPJ2_JATCU|nr:hypothetical protein JCGZ_07766 [Jatropha curcas]